MIAHRVFRLALLAAALPACREELAAPAAQKATQEGAAASEANAAPASEENAARAGQANAARAGQANAAPASQANAAEAKTASTPPQEEKRPKVDVYRNPNGFDAPPIAIGDPAPALTATEWIGAPVEELRGRVHVIEFWATWCQPCQKAVPELKRLARTHGDKLRLVAVAAAETGDANGVREFAARAGIDYSIAYADDEALFERWMRAARVSGLPWVFIVDAAGRVAWWGQPFETEFEPILRDVVAGEHDPAAMQKKLARRQSLDREGWDILQRVYGETSAGKLDEALADLDRLIALDPGRFWYEVAFKFMLLLRKSDFGRAYAYGRQIVSGHSRNNPHALHDIGTSILDLQDEKRRDLDLARQALERAYELTHGENPDILRSLARLRILRGEKSAARKLLEEALRYSAPADRPAVEKELAAVG